MQYSWERWWQNLKCALCWPHPRMGTLRKPALCKRQNVAWAHAPWSDSLCHKESDPLTHNDLLQLMFNPSVRTCMYINIVVQKAGGSCPQGFNMVSSENKCVDCMVINARQNAFEIAAQRLLTRLLRSSNCEFRHHLLQCFGHCAALQVGEQYYCCTFSKGQRVVVRGDGMWWSRWLHFCRIMLIRATLNWGRSGIWRISLQCSIFCAPVTGRSLFNIACMA